MTQISSADTALKESLYKARLNWGSFPDDLEDKPVIFIDHGVETKSDDSESVQFVVFPSSWTFPDFGMLSEGIKQKGNSTKQAKPSEEIIKLLLDIFSQAKEEIFESGIETEFSRNLLGTITKYNSAAMDVITDLILSGSVNTEVAAETMRWLGLMESRVCYRQRRWLLARCLRDVSERVRDAASLGLSYLDDPWAIPYLENAVRDELIPELRSDMEQVLEQLKNSLENS